LILASATYFGWWLFRQLKTRNAAFCPLFVSTTKAQVWLMLHCPKNTARNIMLTTAFSATLLATSLAPALAADPTGDWRVADGVANIRVAECNGAMWGVVAWEKEPGGRDTNNPDVAKRSRPTLGMPILIDMKKKPGVDQWEGQVYNAKNGQLYSSTIHPIGPDQLEIRGCVLGFLCGGETWTRVAGPIPSSPANSMARARPGAAPPAAAPKALPGKKIASASPADQVGDICLLRDIAGFAH
jgi:uncharacterized protein (DUF2147 family)